MEYNEKQMAILAEAERLFAQNGFDGTSVRDIAMAAGVNVAMISYYFGSKEKLMEALFETRAINISLRIENLLQDEKLNHLDRVYILIDDFIQKFFKQQRFHAIMVHEQLKNGNKIVGGFIQEMKRNTYNSIRKLIAAGQKTGEFKKNIDVMLMMNTMTGTVNGTITNQHLYKEFNNMNDLSEEEFQNHLKKKLSIHLKNLFKKTLTNETH